GEVEDGRARAVVDVRSRGPLDDPGGEGPSVADQVAVRLLPERRVHDHSSPAAPGGRAPLPEAILDQPGDRLKTMTGLRGRPGPPRGGGRGPGGVVAAHGVHPIRYGTTHR